MTKWLWRIRYTFSGRRMFGWRTAWYFSGEWVAGRQWEDHTPADALYSDIIDLL